MRKLVLTGLLLGACGLAAPAAVAGDSQMGIHGGMAGGGQIYGGYPRSGYPVGGMQMPQGGYRNWGPRPQGRWWAGWQAPGGWSAYQRPVRGFVLPTYWINPGYYIADYTAFGLPAPAYGYGWSRYYDDAVLTDRYGRVVDTRYGYDWDRYGGYADYAYDGDDYAGYDGYPERRRGRGNAVAGAVIGGGVGALAGSAIAGRGNRTTGALLGAGVGAIAGAAIADSAGRDRRRLPPPDRRPVGPPPGYYGYGDDDVTVGGRGDYEGRWVGTWYGRDGSTYSGTYDGRYEGDTHWRPAAPVSGGYAPTLPYAPLPVAGYGWSGAVATTTLAYAAAPALVSYQYDYAEPVVSTTVTEEKVYRSVQKRAVKPRVWRARPVPCSCSCVCR